MVAPETAYVPAVHGTHVLLEDAPTAADAVPAAHATQDDSVCPGAALYVPARHAKQAAADVEPGLFDPVPAGQSVQLDAPATLEYAPGLQERHAFGLDWPTRALYVPAEHGVVLV